MCTKSIGLSLDKLFFIVVKYLIFPFRIASTSNNSLLNEYVTVKDEYTNFEHGSVSITLFKF